MRKTLTILGFGLLIGAAAGCSGNQAEGDVTPMDSSMIRRDTTRDTTTRIGTGRIERAQPELRTLL